MKALIAIYIILTTYAYPKLLIAIPEHPNYAHAKKPGYFNHLLKQMEHFEGVEFVFLPIERAVKEYYAEKKYNCFVGGDEKLLKFYGSNIENRYFSAPHMAHSSHIFN